MAEAVSSIECPICFTTIRTKGMLECMHCFCVTCIVEWRGNRQTQKCPICKTTFQDILKIHPDGSSKVIEPKKRQTFPHSRYQHNLIRPSITPLQMALFEGFETPIANRQDRHDLLFCTHPREPRTNLPIPIPEPMISEPDFHIPELLLPHPVTEPTAVIPEIGIDQYCALFFCVCGNSWESRKTQFIVDSENCPNCKRDVLPEY